MIEPLDPVDDMIDAVERYVLERQLHVAEFLAREFLNNESSHPMQRSGFAILSIIMAYFEMIEQFVAGVSSKGESREFFRRGFRRVYPDSLLSDDEILSVYRWVRCGMYHGGMSHSQTHLSRFLPVAFEFSSGSLCINPGLAVRDVRDHFERYLEDLRDPFNCNDREQFLCYCLDAGLDRPVDDYPTQSETTAGPFDVL